MASSQEKTKGQPQLAFRIHGDESMLVRLAKSRLSFRFSTALRHTLDARSVAAAEVKLAARKVVKAYKKVI
jgi:hypothetical protein